MTEGIQSIPGWRGDWQVGKATRRLKPVFPRVHYSIFQIAAVAGLLTNADRAPVVR